MRISSLAYLFSPLIINVAAQSVVLDPVVVEATRIERDRKEVPASISVIDVAEVDRAHQALGVDAFLATVPSTFFQSRYNFAQDLRISIRGFGARSSFGVRGIRLLVDDVPETLPDGQTQVDAIDLGDIDSIEVIRGPSSALYGNASGGVVRIKTRDIADQPQFSLSQQLGEFDFNQTRVGFSQQWGNIDFALNLRRLELDGYRDHASTENLGYSVKWRYHLGQDSLAINVSGIDSPSSLDPGGLTAQAVSEDRRQARLQNVLFNAGETVQQQRISLSYSHQVNDDAELRLQSYITRRDFENRLPFETAGSVELDRSVVGLGLQYSDDAFFFVNDDSQFTIGLDVEHQDDDRQRFDNLQGQRGDLALDQNERVSTFGVYLQQVIDATDSLSLTLGARYDYARFDVKQTPLLGQIDESGRISFNEASYFLGATQAISETHNVFVNVSTSFETPTITEFGDPDGSGFNQALDAQTAVNLELGIKAELSSSLFYALSVYTIESDGELVPFELDAQPGRVFFRNAGETRRSGVELEWGYQVNSYWRVDGSYSYANNRFTDFVIADQSFSGNQLPGIPQQQFALAASYQNNAWMVAWSIRAVDRRYANNENTVAAAGYGAIDLRFAYAFDVINSQYELFAGINNILDKEYIGNVRINAFGGRFFEPDPKRNFYVGLRLRLN